MPVEPNQNMDELLKAYAKERREKAGAPFELHSADRKLLQAEVARRFKQNQKSETRSWFSFWPRLALAGSVAAMAVFFIWNGSRTPRMELAQKADTSSIVAFKEQELPAPTDGKLSLPAVEPVSGGLAKEKTATTLSGGSLEHDSTLYGMASADQDKTRSSQVDATGTVAQSRPESKSTQNTGYVGDVDRTARALKPDSLKGVGTVSQIDGSFMDKDVGTIAVVTNAMIAESVVSAPASAHAWSAKATSTPQPTELNYNAGLKKQLSLDAARAPVQNSSFAKAESGEDTKSPSRAPVTVTVTPAPVPGAPAAPAVAAVDFYQNTSNDERYNFKQVNNRATYRRNYLSPPMPNVLTSFEMELKGNEVHIVDNDGSIYNGRILETNLVKSFGNSGERQEVQAAKAGKSEKSSAVPQSQDNGLAFRVSGYNRFIKQNVVFTGNLVSDNGLAQNSAAQNSFGISQTNKVRQQNEPAQNQTQPPATQANQYINGRVQVGGTSEFTIEAIPARNSQ